MALESVCRTTAEGWLPRGWKDWSAARPVSASAARLSSPHAGYNNWLPALAARYRVQRNWSVYGQFAEGSMIPPSAVFDVPNAAV